jgi:hypothetical protein
MIKTAFLSFGRRAQVALIATVAAAGAMTLGSSYVDASPLGWLHDDEAEIAKLTVCYALATDAVGRGDTPGGKEIYKPCFTKNAVLTVYFPGPPFTAPLSETRVGTDEWADFVEDTFVASGYTVTQHLIGSIDIHVDGNQATMTSYLHATHVLPNGTIDVANGTYEDEVVRKNGTWKIKTRTLKLITFLNLGTPAL